jgi:ribose transport system permease protein
VAAVVVGGASLSGGIGTLAGTVVGVLTISVLGNVLNLLTISPMLQSAIKGVVILLAVYMNTQRKET